MITRKLLVKARLGLHARAAAKLVRLASGFQSKVVLRRADGNSGLTSGATSDEDVDAKSIFGLLMLAATCGTQLEASAEGIDEEAAMNAIDELFADSFGEMELGQSK